MHSPNSYLCIQYDLWQKMKLIIIDDNPAVRTTLRLVLSEIFDEIVCVGDPRLIPALLLKADADAVLLDMNFDSSRMDGSDGLFWLKRMKEKADSPAVIMITAFGELNLAVEAMKSGAEDFITKPWDNDELIDKLVRAIQKNNEKRNSCKILMEAREIEKDNDRRKNMTLDQIKMSHVNKIVQMCGGNLSAAAERLGINRQTLYNLLKKQ